jgi:hypothetical protein
MELFYRYWNIYLFTGNQDHVRLLLSTILNISEINSIYFILFYFFVVGKIFGDYINDIVFIMLMVLNDGDEETNRFSSLVGFLLRSFAVLIRKFGREMHPHFQKVTKV